MGEQSIFIVALAMYGTWHLVGRFSRWVMRGAPREVILPDPHVSTLSTADRLWKQDQYIRKMERQG